MNTNPLHMTLGEYLIVREIQRRGDADDVTLKKMPHFDNQSFTRLRQSDMVLRVSPNKWFASIKAQELANQFRICMGITQL